MQRTTYAAFPPSTREDIYIPTINKVLGHIERSQPGFRDFREWLKDQDLWSKEETPNLLEFLDIKTDGVVRLGPFARRFFETQNDDQARDVLYKHLVDQNTLLVKYAFEALDTEGGGRLHSTHELHRFLTSYVYPGKHVTLTCFQAWIKWAVVSGRIKFVGIRWGLTDTGKQSVPRLRSVDPDEFLEDERLEEEETAARSPQPPEASSPAPAVKAKVEPAAKPEPKPEPTVENRPEAAKGDAAVGQDDEELPDDLPPETEAVSDEVFQKFAKNMDLDDEALAETAKPVIEHPSKGGPSKGHADRPGAPASPPAADKPIIAPRAQSGQVTPKPSGRGQPVLPPTSAHPSVAAPAPSVIVPSTVSGDALERLRAIGRLHGLGGGSLLAGAGLAPAKYAQGPTRYLFLAGILARLAQHADYQTLVEELVERAGSLDAIGTLFEQPQAWAEMIVRWGLVMSDRRSVAIRAATGDALIGARALASNPDLPKVLGEATSPETLLGQLQQTILRGAQPLALFWLVREMVRAGLWTGETARTIALVPSTDVRATAYRLGLLDAHYATGTPALLAVARHLAQFMPPGSPDQAALETLPELLGCRFGCPRARTCDWPCREREGQ